MGSDKEFSKVSQNKKECIFCFYFKNIFFHLLLDTVLLSYSLIAGAVSPFYTAYIHLKASLIP